MTEQPRHEPLTPSPAGDIELTRNLANEPVGIWQQYAEEQEGEREYEAHLRSLQQYICELLIRNQELRWSLELVASTVGCGSETLLKG
jgi:AraC-like DNA-binding protein